MGKITKRRRSWTTALYIVLLASLLSWPAAQTYGAGAVVLASAIPDQPSTVPANTPTFDVFLDNTIDFTYEDGFVLLSTCPDGSCTIVADDAIRLTITHDDGTQWEQEFDFYTTDFPPADLTAGFAIGHNSVQVEVIDLVGPTRGLPRDLYLVPADTSIPPDRIPPVIHSAKRWTNGAGYVSIQARVTDNVAVGRVVLLLHGGRILMRPIGGDLYETIAPIPAAQVSTFSVEAVDTSNNIATFPRSAQASIPGYRSKDLGSYNVSCGCYQGSPGQKGAVGDPVITEPETGNYADVVIDLIVAGVGDSSIQVVRGFNSLPNEPQGEILYTEDGDSLVETPFNVHPEPFGRGSSFLLSLLPIDNLLFKGVQLRDEDGRIISFADSGGATLTPAEPRVFDTLTKDGGGYVLRRKDLTTFRFTGSGQLVQKSDHNGNTITYTWDGKALRLAENSAGRQVSFVSTAEGRITDIYAPEHIHLHYEYIGDLLTSFTDAEANTWHYQHDDAGRLTAIMTPKGHPKLQLRYDAVGRVASQTLGLDRVSTFAYDIGTRTTIITDPDGKQTTHVYNAQPELAQSRNAAGAEHYDYQHGLRVGFRDRADREWQYSFDNRGNLLSEAGPLGWHRAWQYNGQDLPTRMQDPLERNWLTSYDSHGNPITITNPLSATSSMTYDSRGLPLTITDFNRHTTTQTYDPVTGDLLQLANPKGDSLHYTYNGMGWVKTVTDFNGATYTYSYNQNGDVTAIDGPLGFHLAYGYDANGNLTDSVDPLGVVTHIEYNDIEKPTATIENYRPARPADHETNLTTRFAYSRAGDLASTADRLGQITTYLYDDAHRLIGQKDAQEHLTRYELDRVGNILAIVDRNEHRTEQTFDELDRLTARRDAENHREEHTYDIAGNLRFIKNGRNHTSEIQYDLLDRPVVIIDPQGHRETFKYDGMGNLIKRTDQNGHSETFAYDATDLLQTYTDAEGNITKFAYDKNGNTTAVVDGNEHRTRSTFNLLNQLESTTNGENQTTRFNRNLLGNLLDQLDPDGRTTHYSYDPLQRLVGVTLNQRPGKPATADQNVTHRYGFDAQSNLKAIIDPLGHTTRFEHDTVNRLIQETDPENHIWTYAYDHVGNLLTRRDANGKLARYSYYADDQLKRIEYADGSLVGYEQDANHNITRMTDHLGATTASYDELDRDTYVTDALNHRLAYRYDAVGNMTSMTYPDGRAVTYTYQRNNWLKAVIDPAGDATTYKRDGVGLPIRTTNPNDTVAEMRYDRANRLVKISNLQVDKHHDDLISAFSYSLNEVGHKVKVTQDFGWQHDLVEKYTYDGLRRLASTQDSKGYQASYRYDAAGNRVRWWANDDRGTLTPRDEFSTSYTYNKANQLQQAIVDADKRHDDTAYTFRYDSNGNLINKQWDGLLGPVIQGTDYAYDLENQLVQALDYQQAGKKRIDHDETRFIRDGNGLRLAKEFDPKHWHEDTQRTEYVFAGLDPVAEYDSWNDQHRNFYRGDAGRFMEMQQLRSRHGEGSRYWYHYEGLGSVSGLTTEHGQSAHIYRYDAFGAVYADSDSFTDPHNRYTFTGQKFDEHTGLYEFFARPYDPTLGVWLTQDRYRGALDVPMSLHRYQYVDGNPVNYVDRYGFQGEGPIPPAPTLVPRPQTIPLSVGEKSAPSEAIFMGCCAGNNENLHHLLSDPPIAAASASLRPPPQYGAFPQYAYPGANLEANMHEAAQHKNDFGWFINAPLHMNDPWWYIDAPQHIQDLEWFINKVKTGGDWDYKKHGSQYQDFGNFHYGLVGRAAGYPEWFLLSGAGIYQIKTNIQNIINHNKLVPSAGVPFLIPPYGDDCRDQYWISQGYHYNSN